MMCTAQEFSSLYPRYWLQSYFPHVWQNYGTFRDRGLSGKQKSTSNDRPIYSPEVRCAWPSHIVTPGTSFWNEHWSKVISQRTPAPHSTAKPPAKFFFSRHISGNLPVCLQGTSVNVRAKSQMNVKMCKQKRSFFLLLSCGTASKGDRVLFQPFHFSRDVFFCFFPAISLYSHQS